MPPKKETKDKADPLPKAEAAKSAAKASAGDSKALAASAAADASPAASDAVERKALAELDVKLAAAEKKQKEVEERLAELAGKKSLSSEETKERDRLFDKESSLGKTIAALQASIASIQERITKLTPVAGAAGDIKLLADKIDNKFESLEKMLTESKVEHKSISNASESLMRKVLVQQSFVVENSDPLALEAKRVKEVKWDSFRWPSGKEEDDTPAAVELLQGALVKAGASLESSGQAVANWSLHDVHVNKKLFQAQFGRTVLTGGTDAIIVPAKMNELSFVQGIRVLFEFKLPSAIKNLAGQPLAELFAASSFSRHPCLLVCTDLDTTWEQYVLGGDSKCGKVLKSKHKVSEGIKRVVAFLSLADPSVEGVLGKGAGSLKAPLADMLPSFERLSLQPSPLDDQLGILDLLPPHTRVEAARDITGSWLHMFA